MTPERLAKYRAKATEAPWGTDFRADILNLLDHIRDLETQVRELSDFKEQFIDKEVKWLTAQAKWIAERNDLEAQVREARDIINEIRSEAQRTINWNQTRGMRPATDTSMFAGSYGTALRVSRLIDAVLATATPPSPEVEE